jgi:hypothetical protein
VKAGVLLALVALLVVDVGLLCQVRGLRHAVEDAQMCSAYQEPRVTYRAMQQAGEREVQRAVAITTSGSSGGTSGGHGGPSSCSGAGAGGQATPPLGTAQSSVHVSWGQPVLPQAEGQREAQPSQQQQAQPAQHQEQQPTQHQEHQTQGTSAAAAAVQWRWRGLLLLVIVSLAYGFVGWASLVCAGHALVPGLVLLTVATIVGRGMCGWLAIPMALRVVTVAGSGVAGLCMLTFGTC